MTQEVLPGAPGAAVLPVSDLEAVGGDEAGAQPSETSSALSDRAVSSVQPEQPASSAATDVPDSDADVEAAAPETAPAGGKGRKARAGGQVPSPSRVPSDAAKAAPEASALQTPLPRRRARGAAAAAAAAAAPAASVVTEEEGDDLAGVPLAAGTKRKRGSLLATGPAAAAEMSAAQTPSRSSRRASAASPATPEATPAVSAKGRNGRPGKATK